jgi:hypothetical protein
MVARIARAMVENPDEVSASVGEERGEFVRGRRQAGQVEGQPPQERGAVGFG